MDVTPRSLREIIAAATADMGQRLELSYADLRRSAHRILARWLALAAHGMEGFASWAGRQQRTLSAQGDQLDRIATLWGTQRLAGESDTDLRRRVVALESRRPPSGSVADYRRWVIEAAPTATGVWVTAAGYGAGTVLVWYAMPGTGASIVPDGASIAAVQAYLDDRRHVACFPMVFAPPLTTVALTITLSLDTARQRSQVISELEALLAARRGPGVIIRNSEIRAAIGRGASAYYVLNSVNGDGLSDVTQIDSVAALGVITWL